jgi:hypothetical protein
MASKSNSNSNKNMKNLNDAIELHQIFLDEYIKTDNNDEFIKQMDDFREFLKNACKLSSGFMQLYVQFKEQEKFHKYKDFFMFCESFHERLIEVYEKENILQLDQSFSTIKDYLSLEYNRKFYQDILTEFDNLDEYMKVSNNFVMVGCGSFPITMFVAHEKYNKLNITGIDSSAEAIMNAKKLKSKLSYKNILFDIIDGINYDYSKFDTIFIANLVIPKTKVLKRIAMTCCKGTKILLRVPIVYGSLLSEDVNYASMNSFKLVDNIEPSNNTDDILYKLLVLEKI